MTSVGEVLRSVLTLDGVPEPELRQENRYGTEVHLGVCNVVDFQI